MGKILNIIYSYSKVPERLMGALREVHSEWQGNFTRQESNTMVSLMSVIPTDGESYVIRPIEINPQMVSMVMDDYSTLKKLQEGKLPSGLLEETRFAKVQVGNEIYTIVGTSEEVKRKLHSNRLLRG